MFYLVSVELYTHKDVHSASRTARLDESEQEVKQDLDIFLQ